MIRFIRKGFVFFLALVVVLSFCFSALVVSADVDEKLSSQSNNFVNLLDCSTFKVTYYDSNGSVLRIDPVTSRPWSVISGFASMEIYWTLDHPIPVESLYLAKTQRSAQAFAIYINGTNLTSYFTDTGIANQVGFSYAEMPNSNLRLINNVRIVFSGLDISSIAPVGIVQFVGNILDTYSYRNTGTVTTSVNAIFDNDVIFDDIVQVSGPTSTNTFEFSNLIRLPSTAPSNNWYWGQVDLVLPLAGLYSENLDYLEWNCFTYGGYYTCTAYLSDSSNPNTSGVLSDVIGIEVLTNSIGSSVPVLFDRDWSLDNDNCYGYQFLFNLNDIDIHEKYLHICLKIHDYEYSNVGFGRAAYIESAGFSYKINYIKSGSALDRVSSYLYQLIEQGSLNSSSLSSLYDLLYNFLQNYNQPDYSASLNSLVTLTGDNKQLLTSILTVLQNHPNYESILVEMLSTLGSISFGIENISDWLNDFSPESGSDFNNSVSISQNIYQNLDQQLSILETVPKTSLEEFENQNDHLMSVVDDVLPVSGLKQPDFAPDSPTFASTPLTFTALSGVLFDSSVLGGFPLGEILLLVCSIALVGYVLFGKRG